MQPIHHSSLFLKSSANYLPVANKLQPRKDYEFNIPAHPTLSLYYTANKDISRKETEQSFKPDHADWIDQVHCEAPKGCAYYIRYT